MDFEKLNEKEWRERLSKDEFQVLRLKGTERPFTGRYLNNSEKGIYKCAGCETPLFESETKYDSSCGWPSFFDELVGKIKTNIDSTHGMIRKEIVCIVCEGHLGHVFDDGPEPTGLRYCVNGYSLKFEKLE